jgi:hypothetical protein
LTARPKSLERALEEAVSRALRDNLAPLQRTADELHQAYADLVAACSSTRPSNALPAMLRAQTAASSLAAGLSVLSNFVAVALNSRDHHGAAQDPRADASTAVMEEAEEAPEQVSGESLEAEPEWELETPEVSAEAETHAETVAEIPPEITADIPSDAKEEPVASEHHASYTEQHASEEIAAEAAAPVVAEEVPAFEVASLPSEMQDLHRRANRVAKVAMQDIQLLRPKDVRLGREHKDLCDRLRSDLDKARKEYDRRFRSIQDHPVDYFHRWMVDILADGDEKALGEYPYPSPVLRH